MRLLFDQGTPAPLRRHLTDHSVDTLAEKGWSDKGNGELLDPCGAGTGVGEAVASSRRGIPAPPAGSAHTLGTGRETGRGKPVPYSPACSLQ